MRVVDDHLARVADFFAGAEAGGRQARRAGDADREEVLAHVLQPLVVVAARQVVLVAQAVVDAYAVVVDDFAVHAQREVVIVTAAGAGDVSGRQRVKVQYLLRDGVYAVGRDAVAGEVLPGQRVFDAAASGEGREVAVARADRRHVGGERKRQVIALPQVVVEEEGAVLEDAPADRAAEFMRLLHGLVRDEAVAALDGLGAAALEDRVEGVERRVAAIVVERAVEVVGAGLGRRVDDGAGGATDLGGRNAGRDFELGDGVGVREDADGAELRLVVVNAVEREVVIGRALAVDDQGAGSRAGEARGRRVALLVAAAGAAAAGARVAVVELARVGAGAAEADVGAVRHARRQRRQQREVAARQRQLRDLAARDDAAALAGLCLHDGRPRADVDDFAGAGRLQRHVNRQRVADVQLDVVERRGLKALRRGADFVSADVEQGHTVDAFTV